LVKIAGELDESIGEMGLGERGRFEQKVRQLTAHTASQPNFSGFHPVFRDLTGDEATPEGDVRRAFYLSYDDTNCEYLTGEEIDDKLDASIDVVSATFVTPYPPGFPVLVPGQVFSREILKFMRELDTPEIHGYKPEFGYRVYTEKAIEMCRPAQVLPPAPRQTAQPAPVAAAQPASPPPKAKKSNGNRPEVTEASVPADIVD
jgi:arginine decarboxylase